MEVASLPVLADKSSVPDGYTEALGRLIAKGEHPADIARKLHPDDRPARKRAYRRLRALALHDARVARATTDDIKLEMMVGLGPAVKNLIRQTRRRPDATKLLLEASGFHNPRVKHDHSGEINVRLTIPRPTRVEDVPDADVVED